MFCNQFHNNKCPTRKFRVEYFKTFPKKYYFTTIFLVV